ncbi:hypothetical protein [Angelakisella massiliensis]|uniref:hypothetical protein n=1 Tax=Angelakisella massiliensis TaxID=1871018 RepID=UPI0024B15670|nr:hypothetical protein [Angelakisella massiliensis]
MGQEEIILIKFSLKQIKPEPFLFRRLPLLSSPAALVLPLASRKTILLTTPFGFWAKRNPDCFYDPLQG